MKSWSTKSLGEVLEISRERIEPTEHPDTPFNYVGLESIEGHTGRLLPYQRTPGVEIKSTKNVFHRDEILYGKLRPYLNKVYLASEDGICSTDIYVLRPRQQQIHPAFAAHYLRSPSVLAVVSSAMAGANLPRIGQDALLDIPISVPPLAEQERIVKLLQEADELRKLRGQANRYTATLIPALFHEMFGDPETNLKGWPRATLKDFGAEIRYGLGQPPETDPHGVPILRATNIKRGYISDVGLIRVRREAVPQSRNAFLKADDVLVVRSGAYTGDVARVGEKWVGSVAGYDLVVSPKERLTGEFVASFLLSKFVQKQYVDGLKLRAAQPHLNSTQVSETPFFCPPLPLQKEFAQRVTEIHELETNQAASRAHLNALFNSMLHRAFNGVL